MALASLSVTFFWSRWLPHYWRGIQLPRLMLQGFIQSSRDVIGISDHLGISVATRVADYLAHFPSQPSSSCRRPISIGKRRLV